MIFRFAVSFLDEIPALWDWKSSTFGFGFRRRGWSQELAIYPIRFGDGMEYYFIFFAKFDLIHEPYNHTLC